MDQSIVSDEMILRVKLDETGKKTWDIVQSTDPEFKIKGDIPGLPKAEKLPNGTVFISHLVLIRPQKRLLISKKAEEE